MSNKCLVPFSSRHILSPFVESIQNVFENAFDKFELRSPWLEGTPKANAYTKDGKYVVEVQVPGMKEANVSVSVYNREGLKYLEIEGKAETTKENKDYDLKEYSYSSFKRSFVVPNEVIGDPEAQMKDGLLTIQWEVEEVKKTEIGPKKIPIRKLET